MFELFRLVPAMQLIFKHEIEFTRDSFQELTAEQYEAYERKVEKPKEKVYRILAFEPTVLESEDSNKILLELSIVSASERQNLLDAVAMIYRASAPLNTVKPTFEQRLKYLRPRFPPIVTGEE